MPRWIALAMLLVGLLLPEPASATGPVGTRAQLKRAMNDAGTTAGLSVVDLSSNREIFAWKATTKRIPASVNKLYTTATALERFGFDARLETTVLAAAEPVDGVIDGDIYLRGGGDPTFTDAQLTRLAEQVAAVGVTEITGAVHGDESFFDALRGPPSSGFQPSQYVGILSAIVLNRNLTPVFRFETRPAETAASALRAALAKAGVEVGSKTSKRKPAPEGAVPLAVLGSPTMAELVKNINVPSDNFAAETLLKAIGAVHGGAGSTSAGAQVVRETAAAFGISPRVIDGSGLSRSNRTSPREVTSLLAAMPQTGNATAFTNSLAVAGRNGTLRRRMRGTRAEGNCRGKTGTLNSVSALAGYCTSLDGRVLAFAFLANGVSPPSSQAVQNRIAVTLAQADL